MIKKEVIEKLEKSLGKFSYKLIYENTEQKNYVYLIRTKNKKFVLKAKNPSYEEFEETFDDEIKGRYIWKKLIKETGINNLIITKVISFDKEQGWILFRYEKFETLHEIMQRDMNQFKRLILKFYDSVFKKLFKKYDLNKRIPGEFSTQDIAYSNNKFYFYDLEANKELIKQFVDLYLKVCKHYFRATVKYREFEKPQKEIVNGLRQKAKNLDKNLLNKILINRLESKAFEEFKDKKYKKIIEEIKF